MIMSYEMSMSVGCCLLYDTLKAVFIALRVAKSSTENRKLSRMLVTSQYLMLCNV